MGGMESDNFRWYKVLLMKGMASISHNNHFLKISEVPMGLIDLYYMQHKLYTDDVWSGLRAAAKHRDSIVTLAEVRDPLLSLHVRKSIDMSRWLSVVQDSAALHRIR